MLGGKMTFLREMILHTPPWVWVLLAFLVWLGIKSGRPGRTTLLKASIIPTVLSIWGIYELGRMLGISLGSVTLWVAGVIAGGLIGSWVGRRTGVVSASDGTLMRGADFSALPIILLAFSIKYATAVSFALSPHLLEAPILSATLAFSGGFFPGVFLGKFAVFVQAYLLRHKSMGGVV